MEEKKYPILDQIKKANDIKRISPENYEALAAEIRDFLLCHISETGGHLASNLGAVELTMALHLFMRFPEDRLIWDVGHQSYTHKLLTGRREGFDTLRKFGGMSGFPKRRESDCDAFDTGHSSTSLSAGLGLVKARDLAGKKHNVVAVIGDGAMTGGMAFEALNNASKLKTNYIMILNDNEMSIAKNVGGFSNYLQRLRAKEGYLDLKDSVFNRLNRSEAGKSVIGGLQRAKGSLRSLVLPAGTYFEELGIKYLGPVDGHNTSAVLKLLRSAKHVNGPVILHVKTRKGMGYTPAMRHPARFHGAEPFYVETGIPKKERSRDSYTEVFSTVMKREIGPGYPNVVAITAAMPDGTGLKRFAKAFPERFFDVGIAEEHAVTFAAGLSAGGYVPIVAIYSSFLQRAYDQILHDVCLQELPVVFAVDRAGLVGSDGETHQGVFDISFLSSIPGMHIMAPKNKWELADMLLFAVQAGCPIALRYPRGEAYDGLAEYRQEITMGKSEMIYDEKDIAIFALGSMVATGEKVRELLKEEGKSCSLINARFVKPIDEDAILKAMEKHQLIVTMEENVAAGGLGEKVRQILWDHGYSGKFLPIAVPDTFVEHGSPELLKEHLNMHPVGIVERIHRCLEESI
ncbi:MAG: 1-deoxy-D-xylulose-5-phosphate synthase [Lachnospiraceae bacterium]|nr:1-deoxy-D-xylulose-5-phosphate synthase [Lachnospiraceae bacterium]